MFTSVNHFCSSSEPIYVLYRPLILRTPRKLIKTNAFHADIASLSVQIIPRNLKALYSGLHHINSLKLIRRAKSLILSIEPAQQNKALKEVYIDSRKNIKFAALTKQRVHWR